MSKWIAVYKAINIYSLMWAASQDCGGRGDCIPMTASELVDMSNVDQHIKMGSSI